jgi:hypothetical protein
MAWPFEPTITQRHPLWSSTSSTRSIEAHSREHDVGDEHTEHEEYPRRVWNVVDDMNVAVTESRTLYGDQRLLRIRWWRRNLIDLRWCAIGVKTRGFELHTVIEFSELCRVLELSGSWYDALEVAVRLRRANRFTETRRY